MKTLGDNTVLSMVAYGILTRSGPKVVNLSDFGKGLLAVVDDSAELKRLIGVHCLTTLPGATVLSLIDDLRAAGVEITKQSLVRGLREQGHYYPENGKHLNVFRQWLEYAEVLNPSGASGGSALWRPNPVRVKELLGMSEEDLTNFGSLTETQRKFAQAFASMHVGTAIASDVRRTAETLYGIAFPEGGLPQSTLKPLEDAGLLVMEKTTKGRGAKSHVIHATDLLKQTFISPLLEQSKAKLGKGFKLLTRMPVSQVLKDLDSPSKNIKGTALEALALYFLRRLDLEFVAWRLRSNETGGSEVDLYVEGARLLFSRWQIQCKNTSRLAVEDVAKEVGVATASRTNVVLMVTTGRSGNTVDRFARQVMENSGIQVIVIDGPELKCIAQAPGTLIDFLNSQARNAMAIKRNQLRIPD